MFNRIDLVKITGLSENQIRRLDDLQIFVPRMRGRSADAEYTYNDAIFACVYGIIRGVLKELGFGLVELNDKFKGGLGSEIDFVKNDIFFFNRACFFMIPSTVEDAVHVYKEWIGDSYKILEKLTSDDLREFGLDVANGLFLNTLVVNLFDIRTQIRDKCKQLGIEHKLPELPEPIKAIKKQKVTK